MSYRIEFAPRAKRDFVRLPQNVQSDLKRKIDDLSMNPRPFGSKKLSGEHRLYRIQMGDYRVIYEVQDEKLLVVIVRAGNRREIYR